MSSKRDQVREMIERKARRAIAEWIGDNPQNSQQPLQQIRGTLALIVAQRITEEYEFLELADIMEWRRTRVKR